MKETLHFSFFGTRNNRNFYLKFWTKPSIQSKARPNHFALGGTSAKHAVMPQMKTDIHTIMQVSPYSCKWVLTPTLVTRPSYTRCAAFKPWYSSSNPVALSKITFGWSWTKQVTCRKVPWSSYHKCFLLQGSNSVELSRDQLFLTFLSWWGYIIHECFATLVATSKKQGRKLFNHFFFICFSTCKEVICFYHFFVFLMNSSFTFIISFE